jgi:hypothetical protein
VLNSVCTNESGRERDTHSANIYVDVKYVLYLVFDAGDAEKDWQPVEEITFRYLTN